MRRGMRMGGPGRNGGRVLCVWSWCIDYRMLCVSLSVRSSLLVSRSATVMVRSAWLEYGLRKGGARKQGAETWVTDPLGVGRCLFDSIRGHDANVNGRGRVATRRNIDLRV